MLHASLRDLGWTAVRAQGLAFAAGALALLLSRFVARPRPAERPTAGLLTDLAAVLLVFVVRAGAVGTLVILGLGATGWAVGTGLLAWPLLAALLRLLAAARRERGRLGARTVVRLAAAFVAVSLLLRVTHLLPVELLHEEAYYWLYAKHPAVSYFDHPPFVAWMIGAGIRIAGDTALGVRLFVPLFWIGAAAYVFALTRRIYDAAAAWTAVAVFAALPLFFASGYLALPEAPLLFCWAGATYALYRYVVEEDRRAWFHVGLLLGLGALAKYTTALLALAALVYVLFDRRHRRVLRLWQTYAAMALALLLFAPVIVWNAQHGWASFAHQSTVRLSSRTEFRLPVFLAFAFLHLTPIGAVGGWLAMRAWWRGRRLAREERDGAPRAAIALAGPLVLVPVLVIALASCFHTTKLNWTGPVWIPLLPFVAAWMLGRSPAEPATLPVRPRRWPAAMAVGLLLVYALGLYHLALGLPAVSYPPRVAGLGWKELGATLEAEVNAYRKPDGSRPLVVGFDDDTTAAWIAYYRHRAAAPEDKRRAIDETVGAHLFGRISGMFAYWFPYGTPPTEHLLLVAAHRKDLLGPGVEDRIAGGGPVWEFRLTKDGNPAGTVYLRWVHGFRYP